MNSQTKGCAQKFVLSPFWAQPFPLLLRAGSAGTQPQLADGFSERVKSSIDDREEVLAADRHDPRPPGAAWGFDLHLVTDLPAEQSTTDG